MTQSIRGAMERITAADGHDLDCWIEPAEGKRRGGLVIIQEIFGITDQLKDVAARYAALGYEAAIPALFDRRGRNIVVPYEEATRGREMAMSSDLAKTMMDIDAAVGRLSGGGSVGVIGFCWGGGLALRSAQKLDIAGAVAFYGTRLLQYLDSPLQRPLLAHFGTEDDHTAQDLLDEVFAYLPDMEVHMYEAGHAFANDARETHVPEAADLAHQRTEAFLERVMS